MKLLNYYKLFFGISGIIVVVSIVSLLVFGLKLGIDFKGGSVIELAFSQPVSVDAVKSELQNKEFGHMQVQAVDDNGVIFRTTEMDSEKYDQFLELIKNTFGEVDERRFESIGPVVGEQLTRKAVYQLLLVSLGIVLYIAYAFRKVARPVSSWQFGVSAIIALLHDLLVVLGVFAILGYLFNIEIDSMFVTAMLTVLGFSVHDTIIVFDRIRENLRLYAGQTMEFIANHSISQTLVRSLNTSLTVLFVLLALLLFGGESIRYFVLALFIGIATGTYSSIFIASPLLVLWQNYRQRSRR
jgi:preprotein translocase subunit SecF